MQAEPVSPFSSFADSGMFGPADYDMLDESAEVDHDDMVMEEEEVIMEEQMMDETEDFTEEVDMDAMDDQDGTMGDAPAPENGEHDEPMVDETVEDNRSENYEIIEVQLTDQIPSSDNIDVPSQITESEVVTSHQVESFEFTSSTFENHAFPPVQAEETVPPQQETPVDENYSAVQETGHHSEEPLKDSGDSTHHSEEPINTVEDPVHHVAEPAVLDESVHQVETAENDDAASTHSSATLRNDSSLIEGATADENTTHQSEEKPADDVPTSSSLTGCGEYPYPIIVSYDNSRVLLFPPQDSWYEEGAFDNQYTKLPREFFVQDFNACDETFSELFLRFRDVLGDNVGDDEELHIDMEVLGLRFGEDNLACKNWSLRRVLQAYLSLHRNDGHDFPAPLEMSLYTSPRFSSRLEFMLELVDEGKGVDEYVSRLKLQDENNFHGSQDDDYHSPYDHEDHESVHEEHEHELLTEQDGTEDAEDDHRADQDDDNRETEDAQAEQNTYQDGETADADETTPIVGSAQEEAENNERAEEGPSQDISAPDHNPEPEDEPVSALVHTSELTAEVTVEVTTTTTDTPQETTKHTSTESITPFDEDDDDLLESDDEEDVPVPHSPPAQHTNETTHTDLTPNDAEQTALSVETQESSQNSLKLMEKNAACEPTSAIPVYSPEDEEDHDEEDHGGQYSGYDEPDYELQQYPQEGNYLESSMENYPEGYEQDHGFYDDAEEKDEFEEHEEGGHGFAGYNMQEGEAQVQVLESTTVQDTSVIEERVDAENEGKQEASEGVETHDISEEGEDIPSHTQHELESSFDDDELLPYDDDEEDEPDTEAHASLDRNSGTPTPQKRGREDEEEEAESCQDEDDLQATKRARAD